MIVSNSPVVSLGFQGCGGVEMCPRGFKDPKAGCPFPYITILYEHRVALDDS